MNPGVGRGETSPYNKGGPVLRGAQTPLKEMKEIKEKKEKEKKKKNRGRIKNESRKN